MVKRKCKYCRKMFIPDKRVSESQKACSTARCQKSRKKENNKSYKRRNPNYWEGRYDDYVKKWLEKKPGYQKEMRRKRQEKAVDDIQASTISYLIKNTEENLTLLRDIQFAIIPQSVENKGKRLFEKPVK